MPILVYIRYVYTLCIEISWQKNLNQNMEIAVLDIVRFIFFGNPKQL
jgi:hypothetical protein